MALTSLSIPQNVDFTDPAELKKLNSYLYKLSEEIMYMFNNISPADNFSSEEYIAYKQDLDKVASIQVDVDKIKLDYVSAQNVAEIIINNEGIKQVFCTKDNVVQQINLSEAGVQISGSKINLNGTVTANNYFKINTDGSMECKKATISGTLSSEGITGGKISGTVLSGSTITAGEQALDGTYPFMVDGATGKVYMKSFDTIGVGNSGGIGCDVFSCNNAEIGQLQVSEIIGCSQLEMLRADVDWLLEHF